MGRFATHGSASSLRPWVHGPGPQFWALSPEPLPRLASWPKLAQGIQASIHGPSVQGSALFQSLLAGEIRGKEKLKIHSKYRFNSFGGQKKIGDNFLKKNAMKNFGALRREIREILKIRGFEA